MTTENTNIGLDERAYQGAPHGYAHVWPEWVKHPSQWNRETWSWDGSRIIRHRHKRFITTTEGKQITVNDAVDMLTQMLNKMTKKEGK